MANGADGSIIIDTELDNSGFERGSQRMQRAVSGLTSSVNNLGRSMNSSVTSAVQAMRAELDSAASSAQHVGEALQQNVSYREFDSELSAAGKACTSLQNRLNRMQVAVSSGFNTDGQMIRFQALIESIEQKDLVVDANSLERALSSVRRSRIRAYGG